MSSFSRLHPRLQRAIVDRLGWRSLRPVQEQATAAILDGKNAVVLAPTAGGKTEASMFPVLSQLVDAGVMLPGALYVAPIKALLKLEETAPQKLTYSLISGERIRSLSGSWTITPVPGGIRLEHQIAIDPELPGFLRATYYELSEENLLESLRVLKRLMLRS